MNKFWKYIAQKLTGEQYNDMKNILGCTGHRLTRLFSGHSDLEFEEIKTLAGLTGDNPIELATRFELGYSNYTVKELQSFAKTNGQTLNVIAA